VSGVAAYIWLSAAAPAASVSASEARPGTAVAAGSPAPAAPPAPRRVALDITVNPEGASLFLDGRHLGTAPLTRAVEADTAPHELRAEASGFEPATEMVRFDADLTRRLTLTPSPAPSPAGVAHDPARDERPVTKKRPRRPASVPPLPSVKPPSTAPAARGCNPPYYIGADGLKHYRRECL
jgi:hypothetical protein